MTATTLHPRIGTLVREGRTLYYTFLAGGLYVEDADPQQLAFYIAIEER